VAGRQQSVQDVRGDEALHAAAANPGSAVAVRVGAHRAHPGTARDLVQLRFEKGVSYYREPSGEAAWETFSKGYGPTRSLAANLDPDRREALRKDFAEFHDGFPTELGICVPREYWLTVGVRA
jgi:hypothetical protein